jgi:HJR/Mrr/RecB family endonuclease
MDDVDRLSPLDFEAMIATLFDAMGYTSVLTAAGNDGGADVVAFRDGEITLVQVKHSHSGQYIGKAVVGDLVGASNTYNVALRHSVRMTVVTNSRLSSDAESECRSLGIDVITRAELARRSKQHPILLTDVLKKSDQRCSSFTDGIRRLDSLIRV